MPGKGTQSHDMRISGRRTDTAVAVPCVAARRRGVTPVCGLWMDKIWLKVACVEGVYGICIDQHRRLPFCLVSFCATTCALVQSTTFRHLEAEAASVPIQPSFPCIVRLKYTQHSDAMNELCLLWGDAHGGVDRSILLRLMPLLLSGLSTHGVACLTEHPRSRSHAGRVDRD